MNFHTARETWTPTDLHQAQEAQAVVTPIRTRERAWIEAKIREHESEIARIADKIRLLRLELQP